MFSKKLILKRILPVVVGAALGYAYYYFIGCTGNACPITSNPYLTTGYGLGAGLLLGFDGKKKAEKTENA